MRAMINPAHDPPAVPLPSTEAARFHRDIPGDAPTPVRHLDNFATDLGVAAVHVTDESNRLGLPALSGPLGPMGGPANQSAGVSIKPRTVQFCSRGELRHRSRSEPNPITQSP